MIPRTRTGSPDEATLLIDQSTPACQVAQKALFGVQFHVAPVAGLDVLLCSRNGLKQLRQ